MLTPEEDYNDIQQENAETMTKKKKIFQMVTTAKAVPPYCTSKA